MLLCGQTLLIKNIIDEYDTPIQQGHLNGYYDEAVGFLHNLLSAAMKDNESLEFGILTGILRIANESMFSGKQTASKYELLEIK
jgi:hypothetical protein